MGRLFLNPVMRCSNMLLPTLREDPAEAQIISHRLMLRAGMIRQSASGIYSWLPLGYRILKKIEQIVREEQDNAGAQELLMATIQTADYWRESGRYDDYGKEMLRIKDRHDRDLLYGPTNEEVITAIMRDNINSYKELPQILYHIQWKFRDEIRPRFGVMRGREFYMKDGYSFDIDKASAIDSYNKMFVSYLRTYARMGLKAIPMRADTGAIGGDQSHEFIVLADTGESAVFCHQDLLSLDAFRCDMNDKNALKQTVDHWTSYYAATEEMFAQDEFDAHVPQDKQVSARGIEVGHIFYFGDKYSDAMGADIVNDHGQKQNIHSGSYGIGVSRLIGALIEAYHDDNGIKFPTSVAPFQCGLINLKNGDAACDNACEHIITQLTNADIDVLYDDRNERAGVKFSQMDLIGVPYHLIIGPKGIKDGMIEIKHRHHDTRDHVNPDHLVAYLQKHING